ncbi:hypothetical protein FRC02_010370 [Tulasnella sp. 418]|nr:hypothetical protein FRC02_010370 [Tulasnella sp. 418]
MKGRFIAILVLLFKIVIATPALLNNGEPSQYPGNNASIKGLPDLISLETARELLDQIDKHDKGCIIEFDEKGFEYDVHPATCEYGGELYTCTLSQTILMRDADSVTSIAYDG